MNTEQQTNAVHAKIKVTDLTGKHATLSWDSGSPFAIYNVYQYDYILKSWSLRTQVRVNTVELTDLTPAMFYKSLCPAATFSRRAPWGRRIFIPDLLPVKWSCLFQAPQR